MMSAKNKAFWGKTKAEQRVIVAKDVIKQIKDGFFVAKPMIYFRMRDVRFKLEHNDQLDKIFKQLKANDATCVVCGIGACFTSLVNVGNNAKTDVYLDSLNNGEAIGGRLMRRLLRKVFTIDQMGMIESAFEGNSSFSSKTKRFEAVSFGLQYINNADRLIAIMENIIEHKGTFKP